MLPTMTTPTSLHVAITGATGAVGARALVHLLASSSVSRVTSIGRRPPPLQHEHLISVIADFRHGMAAAVPDRIDVAVCCLGTTIKQAGSKQAFRAVDHDAVVQFAQAAHERGAKRFILVSSMGASPTSSNFYLRTKGEAEAAVNDINFAEVHVLRPSILDDQGARQGSRAGERFGLVVMNAVASVLGKTHRYSPITVDTVGSAIAKIATAPFEARSRVVVLSDGIHAIAAR
jgi:uncharacterized protein YbjT (DUF2867 family)